MKGDKEWKSYWPKRAKLGGVKLTGAFESAQNKVNSQLERGMTSSLW